MGTRTNQGVAAVTALSAVLLAAGLTTTGCGNGGIRGYAPDSDYVMFSRVAEGTTAAGVTDVRCTSSAGLPILSWDVDVEFVGPGGMPATIQDEFVLLEYVVTYRNRTTPGGPVPAPMSNPLPFSEQAPAEFMLENWPIMTSLQKNQYPLNDPGETFVAGQLDLVATVTTFGAPDNDRDAVISTSFDVILTVIDSCADPDPELGCPTPLADPLEGTPCF